MTDVCNVLLHVFNKTQHWINNEYLEIATRVKGEINGTQMTKIQNTKDFLTRRSDSCHCISLILGVRPNYVEEVRFPKRKCNETCHCVIIHHMMRPQLPRKRETKNNLHHRTKTQLFLQITDVFHVKCDCSSKFTLCLQALFRRSVLNRINLLSCQDTDVGSPMVIR